MTASQGRTRSPDAYRLRLPPIEAKVPAAHRVPDSACNKPVLAVCGSIQGQLRSPSRYLDIRLSRSSEIVLRYAAGCGRVAPSTMRGRTEGKSERPLATGTYRPRRQGGRLRRPTPGAP